jgi:hypothetical protein
MKYPKVIVSVEYGEDHPNNKVFELTNIADYEFTEHFYPVYEFGKEEPVFKERIGVTIRVYARTVKLLLEGGNKEWKTG